MSEDFIIHNCENCHRLLLISEKEIKVFPCPTCGCLNDVDDITLVGHLTIKSPEVIVERDSIIDKKVTLREEKDVRNAIKTLLKNGWELKFKK